MCKDCFSEEVAAFHSQKEFEALEFQVQQKCLLGTLVPVKKVPSGSNSDQSSSFYRCAVCGETWELSVPDQAWRGYLRGSRHRSIHPRNPKKALGWWIVVLLGLLGLIWMIVTG